MGCDFGLFDNGGAYGSDKPMKFLEELAARRRFGMKPGLETISCLLGRLGNPEKNLKAIHIAGTNGKGATAAIIDAALNEAGLTSGRYTSPHLVKLNERFFLTGEPANDEDLEKIATLVSQSATDIEELTFFEALTAIAFKYYAEKKVDFLVLETGLGGRLDATNVCSPVLTVITKIGLDHCDYLGDTVEKIAAEKSGIIKPQVPIILAKNEDKVIEVVRKIAAEKGAPFYYAPDIVSEEEIPIDFPLRGAFNRENACTALAALKILSSITSNLQPTTFNLLPSKVDWPGRFQEIGRFIVDGAHNPPAAKALVETLEEEVDLIVGFCGDKDIETVLKTLKTRAKRAYAVKTVNPRSISAEELAKRMRQLGFEVEAKESLKAAIESSQGKTLICGSLFLAGEAIVELGAYPWGKARFDDNEKLSTL